MRKASQVVDIEGGQPDLGVVLAQSGQPFAGSPFAAPTYRIPAVAVLPTGRIICVCDVREDWRDLPNFFDLAMTHSEDGGRSWSPLRPLRRHTPGGGFGDASLLVDPATGELLCWYVGSTGESYFSATPHGPGLSLWLGRSLDGGETWTHEDLSHLRPAGVGGFFCASGQGAVTAQGTLLQPCVARLDGADYAVVVRSTDHGRTWQAGELIGPGVDENKLVGLPDGRVLLQGRSRPRRRQAWSYDDGVSFSAAEPVPAVMEPGCNGGLARVGHTLLASVLSDPQVRRRLAVHVSTDAAAHWSAPILIDTGAAAYSVLIALDAARALLVWEADNYTQIRARVLTLTELGVTETGQWDPQRVTVTPRRGVSGVARDPLVGGAPPTE